MQVRSLGWVDTLEEGVTTYSSILAWRIPWTEEPGYSYGVAESDMTEDLSTCELTRRLAFLRLEIGPLSRPAHEVVKNAQNMGTPNIGC